MRAVRRRLRDASGQALVEAALVLPILVAVVIGLAQFGIAFNNYLRLADATRIGGRAAATQQPDSVSPLVTTSACNAGIAAASANLGSPANFTCAATPVNGATGSDAGVTVTGTYPFSIKLFGATVFSGTLTSTSIERLQ